MWLSLILGRHSGQPQPYTRAQRVFVSVLLMLFVSLVLVEGCLQIALKVPFMIRRPAMVSVEPESQLGWVNREGHYRSPLTRSSATVLPGGFRETGSGPWNAGRDHVLAIGCSFMFGWAISDDETFCWRLQRRLPSSVQVVNAAVPAYGTYQSLLTLERYLKEYPAPLVVVYGMIGGHEDRNIANPNYVWLISNCFLWDSVGFPFCTMDAEEGLVRHQPFYCHTWPGISQSILANILFRKNLLMARRNKSYTPERKQDITRVLLESMDQCCRAHGSKLVVLYLSESNASGNDTFLADHYDSFLPKKKITVVNCLSCNDASLRVPHDGHPNGEQNRRWIDCAGDIIAGEVEHALADRHGSLWRVLHGP